jgi:serine/threonine protein kinase
MMDRDRNLLFGVFAVQLRKVSAAGLMAAAGAWAMDPSKDLPSRLLHEGLISQPDLDLIAQLVEHAIGVHGGNSSVTLAAFGGEAQIRESYGGTIALKDAGGIETVLAARPLDASDRYQDAQQVPGVQETPGRYDLQSEYGRGGMGRVLLVHDAFLGRDVALKELLPGPTDPGSASTPVRRHMGILARFLQEARITGQLEHPSIVPVYELGHRRDGTLYYTMKLVRGKTLRNAIRERKSPRERLELLPHFMDLCHAIAYAHSRRVIHRDLKPDNVMVGEFGETVVLDWGLAKSSDREDVNADGLSETIRLLNLDEIDATAKTQLGQIIGTPAYMAPEQASGEIESVDERSDVYSLGAVLYEVITGNAPFTGTLFEILRKVRDEEPLAPAAGDAPTALTAILRKAMHKDPSRRYQTAKELAEEVHRFLTGALVEAHEYALHEHLYRIAVRHKGVLTTGAAAAAILLVSAVMFLIRERELRLLSQASEHVAVSERNEAQKQHERAEQNFRRALGAVNNLNEAVSDSELVNQPGLESTRRKLLESILAYYKGFVEEKSDDLSLRSDLADAYFRLAGISREIGTGSDAVNAYENAVPLLQSLVETDRENVEHRRALANCLNNLGDSYRAMARLSEAKAAIETGLANAEPLANVAEARPEDRDSLARLLSNMAFLEADLGDLGRAKTLHLRAADIRGRLSAEDPLSNHFKSELAKSQGNLSSVYTAMGESKLAVDALNASTALWGELLALAPTAGITSALGKDLNNLGSQLAIEKDFTKAEQVLLQGNALLLELRKNSPAVMEYQADLAKNYDNLAHVAIELGQLARATEYLDSGMSIHDELARAQPDIPEHRTNLAMARLSRGRLRLRLGKGDDALSELRGATVMLEEELSKRPADRNVRDALTNACNDSAWWLMTEADIGKVDVKEALAYAERAAELSEMRSPFVLDTLAKAHFLSGHLDKARETQRLAIDQVGKDPLSASLRDELEGRLAEYLAATVGGTGEKTSHGKLR